jgi:flagellar basal-body rod modification protein FlgD
MLSTASAVTAETSKNPLSKGETSRNKLSADLDNFLKLLTTQLQHQDPLEPLDTNQFTEQLVQFATVEQQIASNENLEKMATLMDTSRTTAALGYLGRTVDMEGSTISLKDNKANIRFSGEKPAANTTVEILNNKNEVIRSLPAPTGAGVQSLTWDGLNGQGQRLPEGKYNIRVKAEDASGRAVSRSTLISGVVDSVSTNADGISLSVGGKSISADQVLNVRS